jgi:hypothetical protein
MLQILLGVGIAAGIFGLWMLLLKQAKTYLNSVLTIYEDI